MTRVRPAAGGGRIVEVEPERLPRWVERFGERNGGIAAHHAEGDAWTLESHDGTTAAVTWALTGGIPPEWLLEGEPLEVAGRLRDYALEPRRLGVLLARKGAFSVGVVADGRITASKTASAYVQGKTKAGGQSQQRFARRREGQAKAAGRRAADAAAAVLGGTDLDALITGGPAEAVLDDPRLRHLTPDARFGDIAEPKRALLTETAYRAIGFEIRLPD
ncbi:acVLRF1 family peptidyl-tRNA hydrolase [Glycomyces xiaoerkulensis]|uniref:acVLRF1 family peptidyl-tRNA hydrolase n=1 Tax=Glycomyces xiaoerkulensis TaxID=2038139 RepID=UPI000C25D051|nr:acVLRF1 family peptidyl-tRNA hydrolase [Glycomyces xiaoerkulensis]